MLSRRASQLGLVAAEVSRSSPMVATIPSGGALGAIGGYVKTESIHVDEERDTEG